MIKLFKTADMNTIKDWQAYFKTQLQSEILSKRRSNFYNSILTQLIAYVITLVFN